jgi:hypothetical protein
MGVSILPPREVNENILLYDLIFNIKLELFG